MPKSFHEELTALLNKHSKETESDTPDFIMALYIAKCLEAFSATVLERDRWYGHKTLTRNHQG